MTTNNFEHHEGIDLRPILGAIARSWQRIHPSDLTADEALKLLTIFMGIENRLDNAESDIAPADRPKLRLIDGHVAKPTDVDNQAFTPVTSTDTTPGGGA
ncbi:hypothetical protein AAHS21_25240 [Mycobacterium sp. 050272]|uniref:hypothetical protein n=1 Tax=Mycobacterium sp. 050272 TaxID=3142488 RepID=UPI00318583B1